MKAQRIALAAAQHVRGIAARREANQDALLRAPSRGYPVRIQILLQLPVDHVGRQQQRQFAQFRQPAGIRHAASLATVQQGVGRSIHDFDLVGLAQKLFRNAVGERLPVIRSTASCCSRMCCRLTAVMTLMPRSSSSLTSCQRCGLRLPGGLS